MIVTPPNNEARLAARIEPLKEPLMFQTWSNLLFLHWEADPVEIQATLPPGLFVDTLGGKAYVGVTPFFMTDVRAAFLPAIPGTANFMELNVRTYVYDRWGQPGVWFYSLDCNQSLAVFAAKTFFCLPYKHAEMSADEVSGVIHYSCHRGGAPAHLKTEFHYKCLQDRVVAPAGSLPSFLVERYVLFAYAEKTGKLYSGRVYHTPYELCHVQLSKYDDSMLKLNNFTTELRKPDHQVLAPAPLRVKIYGLQEVPDAPPGLD
jgi:uncharacterized protein YqjF (DUF2071 family)